MVDKDPSLPSVSTETQDDLVQPTRDATANTSITDPAGQHEAIILPPHGGDPVEQVPGFIRKVNKNGTVEDAPLHRVVDPKTQELRVATPSSLATLEQPVAPLDQPRWTRGRKAAAAVLAVVGVGAGVFGISKAVSGSSETKTVGTRPVATAPAVSGSPSATETRVAPEGEPVLLTGPNAPRLLTELAQDQNCLFGTTCDDKSRATAAIYIFGTSLDKAGAPGAAYEETIKQLTEYRQTNDPNYEPRIYYDLLDQRIDSSGNFVIEATEYSLQQQPFNVQLTFTKKMIPGVNVEALTLVDSVKQESN